MIKQLLTSLITQVSLFFRQVIKDSAFLEYKIELAMSGLVDGPERSEGWRGRLENLRLWREAWKGPHWTGKTETFIHKQRPFIFKAFGSIYCELNGSKMTFSQPESKLRGLSSVEWTIDIAHIPMPLNFTYDRESQVVAFLCYE